jgi:hypothetical protein
MAVDFIGIIRGIYYEKLHELNERDRKKRRHKVLRIKRIESLSND